MSLGKTLADLRKKAKMTQSELGERLNISAQAISKWENDLSEPDISTIRRLAEIFNVSVSYIIDPDNVNNDEQFAPSSIEPPLIDTTEEPPLVGMEETQLYEVYIEEVDLSNRISIVAYLKREHGFQLNNAVYAIEHPFSIIATNVDHATAIEIQTKMARLGAKCGIKIASGREPDRGASIPEDPKAIAAENKAILKRRFILANIIGGIPGLALMILLFLISKPFTDYLISIYIGFSLYSFIFLLFYPTLARTLMYPIRRTFEEEGCFSFIVSVIVIAILLPWEILVALISPIIYIFSIRKRILRMRAGDEADDIFSYSTIAEEIFS